jgi:hypothetical protein
MSVHYVQSCTQIISVELLIQVIIHFFVSPTVWQCQVRSMTGNMIHI